MIAGVVFCPHPPLLVPELSGTGAVEVAELRAACLSALRRAAADTHPVVVLAAGATTAAGAITAAGATTGSGGGIEADRNPEVGAGGLDEYGGMGNHAASAVQEALPVVMARWLLGQLERPARPVSVVDAASGADALGVAVAREACVLLVMGDASACRGEKAPGYLDVRAEPFDDDVRHALAGGRPGQLRGLDQVLGTELLAAGVSAWRVAGALLHGPDPEAPTRWDAELHYADDPFGVSYFVASWLPAA